MMPITFRPLKYIERDILTRIMTGYTSDAKYIVRRIVAESTMGFMLELVPLNLPYAKEYGPIDAETFEHYSTTLQQGLSFGAYDAGRLVGFMLVEKHHWNRSLWINEFHIAESHRGKGIGRGLMERIIDEGKLHDLRVIGCETQTTNVPAIRFYRKMGFTLDGIDLSLYSNEDWPDGEIALYMKRKLE